jgi:hypothetical protein
MLCVRNARLVHAENCVVGGRFTSYYNETLEILNQAITNMNLSIPAVNDLIHRHNKDPSNFRSNHFTKSAGRCELNSDELKAIDDAIYARAQARAQALAPIINAIKHKEKITNAKRKEVSKAVHEMGKESAKIRHKEKMTNKQGKEVSKHAHDLAVARTGTFTKKIMKASEREGGYLWVRVCFIGCCNVCKWIPCALLFEDDGTKKRIRCPKCNERKKTWIQRDETVSKDQPKHDV